MVYKGELITSLVTIGYIVGLMIGMYIEYCLWAQVAVLDCLGKVNAGFIQILGRHSLLFLRLKF